MENNLTWQEFERVSTRGHHSGSQRFSGGPKTAYQLTIDFGETIEKTSTNYQTLLKG
jgi:hypothetical protein